MALWTVKKLSCSANLVIINNHSAGAPFPPLALVSGEANHVGQERNGGQEKAGLKDVLVEVVEVALVGDDLGGGHGQVPRDHGHGVEARHAAIDVVKARVAHLC